MLNGMQTGTKVALFSDITPGNFELIAGQQSHSSSGSRKPVDITNKSLGGLPMLLGGSGPLVYAISGQFIFTDHATFLHIENAFKTGSFINIVEKVGTKPLNVADKKVVMVTAMSYSPGQNTAYVASVTFKQVDPSVIGAPPVNLPPTAAFTFSATGLDVQFTDGSSDADGSIVSWLWSFGDGTTSTQQNPNHTFSAGSYSVSLTATDASGGQNTTSKTVTVSAANVGPTAAFSISADNLTITLTNSSADSDGSIASYSWDMGDTLTTSTQQHPTVTYSQPGTYNITLTVTDNNGATDTETHSVTVSAPAAEFLLTASGVDPATISKYNGIAGGASDDVLIDSLSGCLPADMADIDGNIVITNISSASRGISLLTPARTAAVNHRTEASTTSGIAYHPNHGLLTCTGSVISWRNKTTLAPTGLTFSGPGATCQSMTFDVPGNLYISTANGSNKTVYKMVGVTSTIDSSVTLTNVPSAFGIAMDAAGNLFVIATGGKIYKMVGFSNTVDSVFNSSHAGVDVAFSAHIVK